MTMMAMVACLWMAQAPEVLDRTLAIVAGRTITLSDARTALALGLVEGAAVDAALVQRLVERELMLHEAERYAPPEPEAEAVETRLAAVLARAGDEAARAKLLVAGGFTEARVRAWVRDDLRLASYLQQRFGSDNRREDLIADWLTDLRRRSPVTLIEP